MYAIATVLPVEQIIFRSNVALFAREGSRINPYEMRMLSSDVLLLVESTLPATISQVEWDSEWKSWRYKQGEMVESKAWYEKNISNLSYSDSKVSLEEELELNFHRFLKNEK